MHVGRGLGTGSACEILKGRTGHTDWEEDEAAGDKVSASPTGSLQQRLPLRRVPCWAETARSPTVLCCWLGPVRKEEGSLSSKAEKEPEGAKSWACQLMAFLRLSGKGDPSCTLCG